jgi:chloramphenicol-sensitive protein RarD
MQPVGVLYAPLAFGGGGLVSLALATTFAAYGLLRKLCPARPLPAVCIETAVLSPLALAWLALGAPPGGGALLQGTGLAPSMTFLLAVFVYGEPFTSGHAFAFSCVWLALAVTAWDGLRRSVRPGGAAAPLPPGPRPREGGA